MPFILNFTQALPEIKNTRRNLRLILWAGDGEHNGISDVKRLPHYDMYLCSAFSGSHLHKNMMDLSESQTICIIDVFDMKQMSKFYELFKGSFELIDADYYGNTPTLTLSSYATLLAPEGQAYHTEGLNGLRMPEENILNILEIFAPILPAELHRRRRWSCEIIKVAKFNMMTPEEAWASPDLKHNYYSKTLELHESFVKWQKKRNKAWPSYANSLEKQWESLDDEVITCEFIKPYDTPFYDFQVSMEDICSAVAPHLQAYSDYLSNRIESLLKDRQNELNQCHSEFLKLTDIYEGIHMRQKILKWLFCEIPPNLSQKIGYYIDIRRAEQPLVFGLSYRYVPKLPVLDVT